MVKVQVNSQGKAYMTSNGKVLLANEGGSTPTLVTKTISENGTYSASSDNADGYSSVTVSVSGGGSSSKFGISIDNVVGNVNNGVLGSPSSINGITFTGVTEIGPNALKNAFNERVPVSGLISFPDLTTVGDSGLNNTFPSNQITSVDLSSLTTVGDYGLNNAFSGNQITSVDLSSLTTVGDYGLNNTFPSNQITSVDLSSLTTVGYYGLYYTFTYNQIPSVDLSSLTTVGSMGLYHTFSNNLITSVNLSNLTTVGDAGLVAAFAHNTDSQGQTTLTSISFPALTSQSFGESTNQFTEMLTEDEGVTVHFPFDLESTISSWDDVTNGFGGTNTTVLFDLNGCELTFNITPNTGNRLSVNGDESSSNTHLVAKSSVASYQIYNSSYGLYISEYSAPDADSATVTVDITTPTYNTISLNTGVSGLTVTVTIDDVDYLLTETGTTGVYTINIYKTISDSVSVNYFVSGGSSYMDENGTLTFNNNDISETITMRAATESQFVRPNLTSDGTLGGDSFAVDADSETIRNSAFYAVDDDVNSACQVEYIAYPENSTWLKYTFYNPVALKTTAIGLKLYNISETPSLTFEASDDNMNWTTLTVTNTDTSTDYVVSTLDNTTTYKYYKITLKPANDWDNYFDCGISDITITATQKVPAV